MKYVYTLTSSLADYYLEQAFVSMFSLKHHMPDAHIVLLMDEITYASCVGTRKEELRYADEVIRVPLDASFNQKQRSRLLKTSAREFVDGDYLYIDCDTVICKPFDSLESFPFELAACLDTHCQDFRDNPYRGLGLRDGHRLGWPVDGETQYFNGGVFLVKDTPLAHEFYRRWQANLKDGFTKGVSMDQPSFAKTNYEMGHVVHVLDDVWNCELKHGIRFLKDARIVHYLTTNTSRNSGAQLFRLNEPDLFDEIKETAVIPAEIVTIAEDPFKGIASLTHVFAGRDVYFFRTETFKTMASSGVDYQHCAYTPDPDHVFIQSPLFFYLLKHYPKGIAGWLNRFYCRWAAFRKKLGI